MWERLYMVKCTRCEYMWISRSDKRYVTCPRCGSRRKVVRLYEIDLSNVKTVERPIPDHGLLDGGEPSGQ